MRNLLVACGAVVALSGCSPMSAAPLPNPPTSATSSTTSNSGKEPGTYLIGCTVTHLDFIFDNRQFHYQPEAYMASPTCGTHQVSLDVYGQVLVNHTYDFRLDDNGTIVQVMAK